MIDRIKKIPFGNSKHQILFGVCLAQLTPARGYRALLLELTNKQMALAEHYRNSSKQDREALTEFELEYQAKLINDCTTEIEYIEKLISLFPEYTEQDLLDQDCYYYDLLQRGATSPLFDANMRKLIMENTEEFIEVWKHNVLLPHQEKYVNCDKTIVVAKQKLGDLIENGNQMQLEGLSKQ